MKDRPILFSAPMVRAILSGTKTQTRRPVVSGRITSDTWAPAVEAATSFIEEKPGHVIFDGNTYASRSYGQPGCRLWVREAWAAVHFSIDPETGFADDWHGSHDIPPGDGGGYWSKLYAADNHPTDKEERGFAWRPSIHMPRWASRITLEIVSVRVERLNDISEDDCIAEGVEGFEHNGVRYWRDYMLTDEESSCSPALTSARDSYRSLWESINGAGSWAANHWVWVVEFRRLP